MVGVCSGVVVRIHVLILIVNVLYGCTVFDLLFGALIEDNVLATVRPLMRSA